MNKFYCLNFKFLFKELIKLYCIRLFLNINIFNFRFEKLQ